MLLKYCFQNKRCTSPRISGIIKNGQQQEARVKTGWIILDSEPTGASVFINDVFVGNTPLDNYKQEYGTYTYRIEHPNYHPSNGSIELNTSRFEKSIKLAPAFGSIILTSNVNGATVLLDGKSTGKTTPCTLVEIPSGQHTVTIQMENYSPLQQIIMVEDGKETRFSATLDARFAEVKISSIPNAEIYSNGKLIGKSTHIGNMMEGYYDIEVKLDHHRSVSKQIQVIAGQSQEISLTPTPIYGSLDVISTPRDAEVSIDNKSYGKTPLTVEEILEGNHSLKISKDGYQTYLATIDIEENENATINANLTMISNMEESDSNTQDWSETASRYISPILENLDNNMVRVKGGTFMMGATSEQGSDAWDWEKPVHQVTLSSFSIGKYEVTQEEWEVVMGSNPSKFKGAKRPVEQVSWDDCQEFIRKLNEITGRAYRLPTEAEWEFAARGGTKSKDYKYAGSDNLGSVAWYDDNSRSTTHEVGQKDPNKLGLYDMSGNVWEWCQDWYGSYSPSNQTNPTGAITGSSRVYRGGSWRFNAGLFRVWRRYYDTPSFQNSDLGLRLAL